MSPADVLARLGQYEAASREENVSLGILRDLVGRHPDALSRARPEGHVTASAVVLRTDSAETRFLLVWHRKLGRWLQPGGHLEPSDESVFAAALREAREETGIEAFTFPIGERILDVDVHPIPAHGSDPPHFHYDIRHLFSLSTRSRGERAGVRGQPPAPGPRWFTLDAALAAGIDSSLERALRKAESLLSIGNRQSSIVNS